MTQEHGESYPKLREVLGEEAFAEFVSTSGRAGRRCHRTPSGLGVTYHPDAESMVRVCDVVTINAPLHPETEHLFDDALIAKMKRGAYIVNTARGKICDRAAIRRVGTTRRADGRAAQAVLGPGWVEPGSPG